MAWNDSDGTGTALAIDPAEELRRRLAQIPPAPMPQQQTSIDALARNPQNLMMPAAPMPQDAAPTQGTPRAQQGFTMPPAGIPSAPAATNPKNTLTMPAATSLPIPRDDNPAGSGSSSVARAAQPPALSGMPPAAPIQSTTPNRAQQYQDNLNNAPKQSDYPAKPLPWLAKVLGAISAGAAGYGKNDNTTYALAKRIFDAPQSAANDKFNAANQAWKDKGAAILTAARLDEKGATTAKEVADTREANARADQLENPASKPQKEVSLAQLHADAVKEAVAAGRDPSTDPKVQQFADSITSLQKQPAGKPEPAIEDARRYRQIVADQSQHKPVSAEDLAWKKGYERDKTLAGNSAATIRIQGLNENKIMNVIRDGQLMAIHPEEMKQGDVMAGASAGEHAMSKQAQFGEIHSAIDKGRDAIKNLDKPLDATQIGKLTLAMKHTSDPSVFRNELETFLGTQELTPAQQDFVVWIGQLNERALSLRNVAGMGQGSDSLRLAIQATLPSAKSGNKSMMNKQMDAFENQVKMLEKGVPKMPAQNAAAAQGGGKTYTQTDVDAAAKQHGMTPQQIEQAFQAKGWRKQ